MITTYQQNKTLATKLKNIPYKTTESDFYTSNSAFAKVNIGKDSVSANKTSYGGWFTCREEFARYVFNSQMRRFLLRHPEGVRENITAFISKIEDKLKLRKQDRLAIVPTTSTNTSIILVSDWWVGTGARKQLLTIFLRCGAQYNPKIDNFDGAIDSHTYARHTRKYVDYFLAGHTINKIRMGPSQGWYWVCYENRYDYRYHPAREKSLPDPEKVLAKG